MEIRECDRQEEESYLENVIVKLKKKIGEIDKSIENIDEEIQKMYVYYW